jgi:hypothetical protein
MSTWLLTILAPALVVIGEFFIGRLKLSPFAFSIVNEWGGHRLTRLIISALPFLILAIFTQVKMRKRPVEGINPGLIGAAIVVTASWLFVWGAYFADFGSGGGANIGVAALVFLSPVYIPILMMIGYSYGRLTR